MRIHLLLAWFVVAICGVSQAYAITLATPDERGIFVLQHADFVLDAACEPPAPEAAWVARSLPDWWGSSLPDNEGVGWYRMRFELEREPHELYSILLPRLGLNAEVFLDGVKIGSGGRFDEPVARYWNRPLLFIIPPGLLREGTHVLDVRLRGHAYSQPFLFPPLIGAERVLRAKFEALIFRNVTINQAVSLMIATIGVFMLNLWLRRRQDTAYGLFGLSALIWGAQSTNLFLIDIPVPTAVWEIFVNASFQAFSALLLISLLRFTGVETRWFSRALWLMMLLSPLSLSLASPALYLPLTTFWHLGTLLAALFTLFVLLREGFVRGNEDARPLVVGMGVIVLFAAHDWLMHSQHRLLSALQPVLQEDIYLLQFAAPMLFFVIGLIMTARYARALNEFEALNRGLERLVDEKHAQLEDSFRKMRVLECEQAAREERERIHSDLHDDVGAKLLSLVYRAGDGENADLARSALQDLRDIVARTHAEGVQLDEALADWRSESEQRLRDAGLELDWQQEFGVGVVVVLLQHAQAINMRRILREAVSNAIRHAHAGRFAVDIRMEERALSIRLEDDGLGLALMNGTPAALSAGRGIQSMQNRARKLGAALRFYTAVSGGLGIELVLPLNATMCSAECVTV